MEEPQTRVVDAFVEAGGSVRPVDVLLCKDDLLKRLRWLTAARPQTRPSPIRLL